MVAPPVVGNSHLMNLSALQAFAANVELFNGMGSRPAAFHVQRCVHCSCERTCDINIAERAQFQFPFICFKMTSLKLLTILKWILQQRQHYSYEMRFLFMKILYLSIFFLRLFQSSFYLRPNQIMFMNFLIRNLKNMRSFCQLSLFSFQNILL